MKKMSFQENLFIFTITDDGEGFDTHQQHDWMGLDSMRERAEAFNASFKIESEKGRGTKIVVTFPIKA